MSNKEGLGGLKIKGEVLNYFMIFIEHVDGWEVLIPEKLIPIFEKYYEMAKEGNSDIIKDFMNRTMGTPKININMQKDKLSDEDLNELRTALLETNAPGN